MVTGQKYHILYKTTCTVTGNFYIGVHSTTNLEDGYLGSGLRLFRSLQKHGKENHIREVLETFSNREELMIRESEVVNEEMLQDVHCLNLKRGGEGGSDLKYLTKEYRNEFVIKRNRKHSSRVMTNTNRDKTVIENRCKNRMIKTGSRNGWKGKNLSKEHRDSIGKANSIAQKGDKNSMYNRVWIFSETEKITKTIEKENLGSFLENGWQKGRKKYMQGRVVV